MSITFFSILSLGFFLGVRHASDADHVIAVSTIVSRQRSLGAAALTGICWGAGHGLTMLIVGGAIVLFGFVVPERLGLSLELGVALMLIVLGVWNVSGTMREAREAVAVGSHGHRHGTPGWLERRCGGLRMCQAIRAMAIGIVHGLAGSAAVTLLVLPIIHDPLASMAYLATFGLGTIAGMMLITALVGLPFLYTQAQPHPLHRWMSATMGMLSVSFGVFLVYQIGFVDGLFTSLTK